MSKGKTPFDTFEEIELPMDAAHWRNAFDSRFLRHFALNGRPRIVTIVDVKMLKSSNRKESKQQLLIRLAEFDKPWAANVTNCDIIERLSGKADPRQWIGLKVELFPTKTYFGNERVDCMRVNEKLPPQDAKTSKPNVRQEVAAYLHLMKVATDLEAITKIQDAIIEDNGLSTEETELLDKARAKRGQQILAAQKEGT